MLGELAPRSRRGGPRPSTGGPCRASARTAPRRARRRCRSPSTCDRRPRAPGSRRRRCRASAGGRRRARRRRRAERRCGRCSGAVAALRGSKTTSSILMRSNRSSRASSSTGRIRFIGSDLLDWTASVNVPGQAGVIHCLRRRRRPAGWSMRRTRGSPVSASSRTAGTGSGSAKRPLVAVVGARPVGSMHPPRRLERDAVRVGEVDRPHEAVVDDVGDLAAVLLQPRLQRPRARARRAG